MSLEYQAGHLPSMSKEVQLVHPLPSQCSGHGYCTKDIRYNISKGENTQEQNLPAS